MNARDRILANLQKTAPNAARAVPPVLLPEPPMPTRAQRVSSLTACLQAARAEVLRVTSGELEAALVDFCRRRNLLSLLLPMGELPFSPAKFEGVRVDRFDQALETFKARLFDDTDAGLTIADCAIADTGLLVHLASPKQPRSLSLVPPIHLCILDAQRIHASLPAAIQAENWAAAMPGNLIFISGPSKTADIQQTLAYGAHGPKELVVFLVDGETP